MKIKLGVEPGKTIDRDNGMIAGWRIVPWGKSKWDYFGLFALTWDITSCQLMPLCALRSCSTLSRVLQRD